MKNSIYIVLISVTLIACTTSKRYFSETHKSASKTDTIRIANNDLHFEVMIIDPGFSSWLNSRAYPRGFHSESYLENKNIVYITEWNTRAMQPEIYNPNLYEMTIDYNPTTRYGYEVKYLIYNYLVYFQNVYNQKINGYVPIR